MSIHSSIYVHIYLIYEIVFMVDVALPFDNIATHIKRSLRAISANTECSANHNAVKAFKMTCE